LKLLKETLTKVFLFLSGDIFNTNCATVYVNADITEKSVGLIVIMFNVLYLIQFVIQAILMTNHYFQ
jgi:hypothetical protein